MVVEDLTSKYLEYFNSKNLGVYENSNSELFEHYFEYWGDRKSFVPALDMSEVCHRNKLIIDELSGIGTKFESAGFSLERLKIILFVGQNYTNGHSAMIDDEFVVFLPVEGYETSLQVKVFVSHEIVHALHYDKNSDFYFSNKKEKETLSRLLITEGLATYVAKAIIGYSLEDALWADYKNRSEVVEWINRYNKNENELIKFALDHFNNFKHSLMFYTADQSVVGKDREGYLLGFKVVQKIAEKERYLLEDLIVLDRETFETKTKGVLQDMLA